MLDPILFLNNLPTAFFHWSYASDFSILLAQVHEDPLQIQMLIVIFKSLFASDVSQSTTLLVIVLSFLAWLNGTRCHSYLCS